MNRALPLAVLLAWMMIQVPLVFCTTDCGQSISSLLLVGSHACHDEEAEDHRAHCGLVELREFTADHPSHPSESGEEGGEHFVIPTESVVGAATVVLPDHLLAVAACVDVESHSVALMASHGERRVSRMQDPPRRADPVTASDRLRL